MNQPTNAEVAKDVANEGNLLRPNEILTGERLYEEAIDIVLGHAMQELLIFDQGLERGGFASIKKYNLLQHFLSAQLTSRLTIILQDANYFQENCPKLMNLLKTFGHKMTVYETNATAKHAKDCFILADGQHYIKRIHIDQARFKYNLDDAISVDQLRTRFDELLETTQYTVSPTTLGL